MASGQVGGTAAAPEGSPGQGGRMVAGDQGRIAGIALRMVPTEGGIEQGFQKEVASVTAPLKKRSFPMSREAGS
jgi:hypothetical protein